MEPTQQTGGQSGKVAVTVATGGANPPLQLMVDEKKLAEIDKKYSIPKLVKEKFPDLIPLILETESMNEDERVYWFQILPIMTEEQIQKFRGILVNEKEQLMKLDTDYESQMKKLNDKHTMEWMEFERKEKRKKIAEEETQAETAETKEEEEVLKKLKEL